MKLCYNGTVTEKERRYGINLKKICSEYRVSIWQCPQFLFLIMGIIIIFSILTTYIVASRYGEPELAALVVLALSAALFLIGSMIVRAFEKVALASRSKSEFISIMSHQLRAPLSAIKWQLNILLQERGDSDKIANNPPETVRGYLETIVEQNERMISAVNDLLDVNRIEDRDLILRPVNFSLKNLTIKIVEENQKYALANNVKITVMAPDQMQQAYADAEKMKRAIDHMIDNAIRYSLNGGNVIISIGDGKNKIVWKITDEGHGISSEDQKRIFEKFFRAPSAARYQTEGSGVGLFIAKSIIKLSGGDIGFLSAPQKGSTFWFSLPVKKQAL